VIVVVYFFILWYVVLVAHILGGFGLITIIIQFDLVIFIQSLQ